ncbi:MAG TPA: 50S ribosomal protein L22, partial [Acidimicrobiaceae bacterium]|nr:50S ribosomal protein L22 [Acidimicrobiaceae bacterium]
MVATKTNERPGTRAVVRYVRVSASKARELLNLVRGESYGRAAEILAFSERSVSDVVGKLLESAVANAENNDGIPAEELFISTCYADEGPTLKRWRPRARGRATRINKRTCHITIIVTRYDEATLETMRERDAAKGRVGSSAH